MLRDPKQARGRKEIKEEIDKAKKEKDEVKVEALQKHLKGMAKK